MKKPLFLLIVITAISTGISIGSTLSYYQFREEVRVQMERQNLFNEHTLVFLKNFAVVPTRFVVPVRNIATTGKKHE